MARALLTHLIPEQFSPEELRGGIAVVIDVLRASSTITTALANGAERVIPCLTIEETLARRDQMRASGVGNPLLGGERQGLPIPGFDEGNSPSAYPTERVQGRPLLFTTTNGTKALLRCTEADQVLIGSFLNLSLVREFLEQSERDIHLVCAGTDGKITLEDSLLAGALAAGLRQDSLAMNDGTQLVLSLAETWLADGNSPLAGLQASQGGRNLEQLGLQADVVTCAQIDSQPVLPIWHATSNEIRLNR